MAKFQIYKGNDNNYHWRLKAVNGEIVSWSEGYNSKQGAKNSVDWTKKYAPGALVEEI
ncbi:MAG: DUF1508 domain-containing protein [Patescibacteria group bacterium]